jgi:sensor c-di-GMP phosphodiesterase-like protein
MIELVIAACLLSATECREFKLLYDPYDVSLMTCMIAGQPEVARWQGEHPDWRVTRWSCDLQERQSSNL